MGVARMGTDAQQQLALPMLAVGRRSGAEPIHLAGRPLGRQVVEFWQWAWSDLVDNTHRGVFAEYLVAVALESIRGSGAGCAAWDLTTEDGTRVEVKTSGYVQSWGQKKHWGIKFNIRPAEGWDLRSGAWDHTVARHADVYIFCVHHHREKESVDPTDVSQWSFWVSTSVLIASLADRRA